MLQLTCTQQSSYSLSAALHSISIFSLHRKSLQSEREVKTSTRTGARPSALNARPHGKAQVSARSWFDDNATSFSSGKVIVKCTTSRNQVCEQLWHACSPSIPNQIGWFFHSSHARWVRSHDRECACCWKLKLTVTTIYRLLRRITSFQQ